MSGESGVLHSATVSAPPSSRVARGRQQVGALARLRDGDEQRAVEVRLRFVDRAHRRRGGGGERVRVRFDEILREGRRVVGAAARAGHDGARWLLRAAARRAPRSRGAFCVQLSRRPRAAPGRPRGTCVIGPFTMLR